jgi:hypothetical protein
MEITLASLTKHVEKVMKTMNKEDQKDQLLTFPAWLAPFTPHLMLAPQGFVMIPGKNDWLVFDEWHCPAKSLKVCSQYQHFLSTWTK